MGMRKGKGRALMPKTWNEAVFGTGVEEVLEAGG